MPSAYEDYLKRTAAQPIKPLDPISPYQDYLDRTYDQSSAYEDYMVRTIGYPPSKFDEEEKKRRANSVAFDELKPREGVGFFSSLGAGLVSGASLGWLGEEPPDPEAVTFGEEAAKFGGELVGGLLPFTIGSLVLGTVGAPVVGAGAASVAAYKAFKKLSKANNIIKRYGKKIDNLLPKAKIAPALYDKRIATLQKRVNYARSEAKAAQQVIVKHQKKYIDDLAKKSTAASRYQIRQIAKMKKTPGGAIAPQVSGKILPKILPKLKIADKKDPRKVLNAIEWASKNYGYKGAQIMNRFINSAATFASVGLVSNKPGYSLVDRAWDMPRDAWMGAMFAAAGVPTILGKAGAKGVVEPFGLLGIGAYSDYLTGRPDPNMSVRDRLMHGMGLLALHYVGQGLSNRGVKEKAFKGLVDMKFDEPIAYEMVFNTKLTDNSLAFSRDFWQKRGSLYYNKKNPDDVIIVTEFKGKAQTKGDDRGYIIYEDLKSGEMNSFRGNTLGEARRKLSNKYAKVDFKNEKLIDDLPSEVLKNADAVMENMKSDWSSLDSWKISEVGAELRGRDLKKYTPEEQAIVDLRTEQVKELEKMKKRSRTHDIKNITDKDAPRKGWSVQWMKGGKPQFSFPLRVIDVKDGYAYLDVNPNVKMETPLKKNRIPIEEAKVIKKGGSTKPQKKYKLFLKYSTALEGERTDAGNLYPKLTLKEKFWASPDELIFNSREAAKEYAKKHWDGYFQSNETIDSKINFMKGELSKIKAKPEYKRFAIAEEKLNKVFDENEWTIAEKKAVINIVWPESAGKLENLSARQVRRILDIVNGDENMGQDAYQDRIRLTPDNILDKIDPRIGRIATTIGQWTKRLGLPTHFVFEGLGKFGYKISTFLKRHSRWRQTVIGASINMQRGLKRDFRNTGISINRINKYIQAFLDKEVFEPLLKTKDYVKFADDMKKITIDDSRLGKINGLDYAISKYNHFYDEMATSMISSNSWIRNTKGKRMKRERFMKLIDVSGNEIKLMDMYKSGKFVLNEFDYTLGRVFPVDVSAFELHARQVSSFLDFAKNKSEYVVNNEGNRVKVDKKKSKHFYLENYSRRQMTEEFFQFIDGTKAGFERAAKYMAKHDKMFSELNIKYDEKVQLAKEHIRRLQQIHGKKNIFGQQYTRTATLPAFFYITRGRGDWGDLIQIDRGKEFTPEGKAYKKGDTIIDAMGNPVVVERIIPTYEMNYGDVLDRYSTQVAHSTATYHVYGRPDQSTVKEKANLFAENLGKDVGDVYYERFANSVMESQIFGEKIRQVDKILRPLARFSAITGLSFPISGLKNLMLGNVQNFTVFTGRELFKAYFSKDKGLLNPGGEFFKKWSTEAEYARDIGSYYTGAYELYLDTGAPSSFMRKLLPNLGLMKTTEILNRTVAQSIGPYALEVHIANSAWMDRWGPRPPGVRGTPPEASRRILTDVLDYTPEQISDMIYRYREAKRNNIEMIYNENELTQSRQQAHIITQGSGDLPYVPYWMGQGWAKPLTLFYRVAYRMTDSIGKNVVKPVVVDGNVVPAMKYFAGTVASGWTLYQMYHFLFNEERVNRFKGTPSQVFDYFLKAEGLALFSNAFDKYGGAFDAYYPVPIRHATATWDMLVAIAQDKKDAFPALGDGLREIVAAYSGYERIVQNITGDKVKRLKESRRRQNQFLDTFYPKEKLNIDYDDGINTKTPYYKALRDVFWDDDNDRRAMSYYSALAFLTHRIMEEKGITRGSAEKEALSRLKRTVSRIRPVPKSWHRLRGRTGTSRYREYIGKLNPVDREEEEMMDGLYIDKKRELYDIIHQYRSKYYKRG